MNQTAKKTEVTNSEAPRVSVVIPTRNRSALLEQCLEMLAAQTVSYSQFEVIVVNDGSTDDTAECVRRFLEKSPVSGALVEGAGRGPAAARNLGIQKSCGELVAFTDDDCLPLPGWLQDLIEDLPAESACAGIGGGIVRAREGIISWYIDAANAMQHSVGERGANYLVTANAMYRRSCLQEVSGFDERIWWPGGEDPDLSIRVRQRGYYLAITKGAIVRHQHRDTLPGLYRMFWNHGRGRHALDQWQRLEIKYQGGKELRFGLRNALHYLRRRDLPWGQRQLFCFFDCVRVAAYHRGYISQPDLR